jgi:geranylgeranyl diphosphate synthase type II
MVLKKTCWYTTIFPLRVGALIGTRDGTPLDPLTKFGFFLGAAFQVQDDVLNLVGDHKRYGKELHGDIFEGKRTLMMVRLFQRATSAELRRLVEALGCSRSDRSQEQVDWIFERMNAYGCLEETRRAAHAFAGAALHECKMAIGALPDSRDKQFLSEVTSWVLHRS